MKSTTSSVDSAEQKKAALDFLDEEIKSLNGATKGGSSPKKTEKASALDSMAAKQMAALGNLGSNLGKGASTTVEKRKDTGKKSAGWDDLDASSGAGLSGDLDFNDLEISFDDQK